MCRKLEVLQDQVEPGSFEEMAQVLQRQLGAPASELFAHFDREPKAAASLAQVRCNQLLTRPSAKGLWPRQPSTMALSGGLAQQSRARTLTVTSHTCITHAGAQGHPA